MADLATVFTGAMAPNDARRLEVAWAEEIERRARLAAAAPEEGEDWSVIRTRLLGEPQD